MWECFFSKELMFFGKKNMCFGDGGFCKNEKKVKDLFLSKLEKIKVFSTGEHMKKSKSIVQGKI